jgi:hypothetical protein
MKQDNRMFLQLLQYRTFPHACTQKNKVNFLNLFLSIFVVRSITRLGLRQPSKLLQ